MTRLLRIATRLLFAILWSVMGAMTGAAELADPVLPNCQLLFSEDIEIPATEAGVLLELLVKEGTQLREGEVLAKIDDRVAQMELQVAQQQLNTAIAQYNDDIEQRYAKAASKVAKADYDDLQEANSGGVAKVVTDTDLRRAKLEWERAELQIEKSLYDKKLVLYDYHTRKAEVDAAELAIERRIIKVPFDGEVLELFRKQQEWVNPGDSILRFVRHDVLQVDGKVYLDEYDPRQIAGCAVTIDVTVGRGRQVQAEGRITLVEQQVQYDGRYSYRVRAEVPNRLEQGRWVLLPGLPAKMTIHLHTQASAVGMRN